MTGPIEAWRRSPWLWGVPLAFCVLNLLVFGLYRLVYAGAVEDLERRYGTATERLVALEQESAEIEAFLARVDDQRRSTERLYGEYFQTEAERFTRTLKEVRRLAREAGLDPTAFSYPQRLLKEEDLIQRGIVFSVEGTYRQLRTFINFLELTEEFVTLDSIALSQSRPDPRDPQLSIRINLSTVFVPRDFVSSLPRVEGSEDDAPATDDPAGDELPEPGEPAT